MSGTPLPIIRPTSDSIRSEVKGVKESEGENGHRETLWESGHFKERVVVGACGLQSKLRKMSSTWSHLNLKKKMDTPDR